MSKLVKPIIDPHIHLFDLTLGSYDWLKNDNPPFWPDKHLIAKNVSEHDLVLDPPLTIAGFVHIEAGFDNQQPWREIDWLEKQCRLPFKTVGSADLTAIDFKKTISALTRRKTIVGIRHILDDEALTILNHPFCSQNFELLNHNNLSFDAQLSISHTPAIDRLIDLANEHSQLSIIINHAGWPPADQQQSKNWLINLQRLSDCSNIAIKLSGWEMTERNWLLDLMCITTTKSLQYFGADRVMLASNFPLSNLSQPYGELWKMYQQSIPVSSAILEKISYTNAMNWYQF